MHKDALISPCGRYRYWLTRVWDASLPLLPIIMLNPSTADADIDDPTIGRCMEFARRDGYGGIRVCNLFALRATKPIELKKVNDPNGPDNVRWLEDLMTDPGRNRVQVLCGWGANEFAVPRAQQVVEQAQRLGADLRCLGFTAAGAPRHPLYVLGTQPFLPFGK